MRRLLAISLSIIALGVGPVIAAIDLRDYDDDLMRDLERTIKYFEPDITARNSEASKEDGEVLLGGFRYTESYFAKKGADDAVAISRRGLELIGSVLKDIERNDFESAAAAARDATQLCKSCHDLYKPRLAR